MSFDASPGLRLEATASRRSWTYRFKSPVDGRMRQQKLGEWPAMSYAAAIVECRMSNVEWQEIRQRHDAGEDPVLTRKASNRTVTASTPESYTVRKLCDDFVALVAKLGSGAAAGTAKDAAERDLVVLAVKWWNVQAALFSVGDRTARILRSVNGSSFLRSTDQGGRGASQ